MRKNRNFAKKNFLGEKKIFKNFQFFIKGKKFFLKIFQKIFEKKFAHPLNNNQKKLDKIE